MNISSEQFNNLNIKEKGAIVFEHSNFIGVREYYNQRLVLYSYQDLFIEVWYSPNENKIYKIELLEDMKILDLYIDSNI